MINILIVDDHPIFRHGLVRLLNEEKHLHVCGEAANAKEALVAAHQHKPDLAIVDIALPGTNGIDLTKMLRHEFPRLTILVLSMYKDALYAERALRAGARGYVIKQEASERLLTAIQDVMSGRIHINEEAQALAFVPGPTDGNPSDSLSQLSDRELQVFQMIGGGKSTRQIALDLGLSIKTIESYRAHIKEKLGLESGYALVQAAIYWNHFETKT